MTKAPRIQMCFFPEKEKNFLKNIVTQRTSNYIGAPKKYVTLLSFQNQFLVLNAIFKSFVYIHKTPKERKYMEQSSASNAIFLDEKSTERV